VTIRVPLGLFATLNSIKNKANRRKIPFLSWAASKIQVKCIPTQDEPANIFTNRWPYHTRIWGKSFELKIFAYLLNIFALRKIVKITFLATQICFDTYVCLILSGCLNREDILATSFFLPFVPFLKSSSRQPAIFLISILLHNLKVTRRVNYLLYL
jgi:hypothetical protein